MAHWQKFGPILAASAAEFLCTLLFVLFGCGSTIEWVHEESIPSVLTVSLAFGFSYAVLVNMAAPLSGGHLNPSVTLAVMAARKLSPMRALCYVISQILGAVSGAGLLFLCVPPESRGWLGVTQIVASSHNGPVSTMVGCAVEFVTTFVFVHTVLVCTEGGSIIADRLVALMLGLAVTACHLFGYPVTGCGINPARSFGPALIMNKWTGHWVYWLGPILGACLAVGMYHLESNFPVTTDNQLVVTGTELEGASDGSPQVKVDQFEDQQDRLFAQASTDIPIPCEMKTTV